MAGGLVFALVGGLALFAVIGVLVRAPGGALAGRFKRAGTLKGRSREEIITLVGPPKAVSATDDGGKLLQWMATGYHMSLKFGADDVCIAVTHESRS